MEGDNIKNENKLRSYNNEENSSVVWQKKRRDCTISVTLIPTFRF